jgi:hypothetical protein
MTKTSTLIASAAVIALTLGVTSRADVPIEKESILPPGAIIVAADEAQPAANQNENSQGSAKMGEEAGTQEGADIGVVPEIDTKKVEQPDRRNPTTGATASDQNASH